MTIGAPPDLIARVCHRTSLSAPEVQHVLDAIRESLTQVFETVGVPQELRARAAPLYCLSNMLVSKFMYERERFTFRDAFRGIVI